MTRCNAPKLGKYLTIFGFCAFFSIIIGAIVWGILDTYCEVVEYGLNKKPTKYSCDQVIFNVK